VSITPEQRALCCCHGHLDGLSLDEMAAMGAPCPTAAFVQECKAQAWDEGYEKGHRNARVEHKNYSGRWPEPNPYRDLAERGES